MVENYSEGFVNKVGRACLGQAVQLDGVVVRMAINKEFDFEPCDACVFQGHCSRDTCDFCCVCNGFDVDSWVYFEKA